MGQACRKHRRVHPQNNQDEKPSSLDTALIFLTASERSKLRSKAQSIARPVPSTPRTNRKAPQHKGRAPSVKTPEKDQHSIVVQTNESQGCYHDPDHRWPVCRVTKTIPSSGRHIWLSSVSSRDAIPKTCIIIVFRKMKNNEAHVHGIMAKNVCKEPVQLESSRSPAQGTSTNEHTPITARMQDSLADESEKRGLPSTLHSETERPALPRSQATEVPDTYAFIAKMEAQMESKDFMDRIKAIEQLAESCCLNPTLATSGIFSVYDGIRGRLVESNRNVNLHMLKALEVIIPQLKEGLPKVASGLIPAIVDNHLNSRNPAIRSAALAAIRALVHNLDNALLVDILANKAQLICGQAKFDLTSTVADMVVEVYSRKPKVVEKEVLPLLWHMMATNSYSTATEALFKALYSQMGSKLMETSMNAQRNEDNKAPVHGIMARKICDEQVQVEGRRSSAQETSMNAQSNEHNKAPVHGIMAKKTCDEQVQVESSGLTAPGTSTNEHTPITARMQDSLADESEKRGLPSTLHSETERPALPRSQATEVPDTYAFIAKMEAQMESKDFMDRIKAIEQLAESCCLNPAMATSGIFSVYDGIRGRLVESNRNVNLHMLKALEVIIPQLKEGLPKVASGLIPAIVDNHLNSRNPAIRSAALAAIRALVHNLDNALLVEILANKAQLICGQAKFDLTSTVADMVVEVYSRKPKVVEKEVLPLLWHMLAINNKSTATEALFKALYSQMGSKLMETSMNAQRNEDNKAPVHGIMARKICDEQVQVEGRRSSAQETSMNAQSNEHNKAPVHGIMAKKTCDEQVQVESSGLTAPGTSTNEHTPITARMQDSLADESEKRGLPSTLHSETERPALPRSQATEVPDTYAFIAKMEAQMESKDFMDRIKAIEQLAESCCLNPAMATSGIFSVYDGIRGRLVESNRNVNLHMLKALEVIIPQLKEGLPKVASGLIPAIVDNHLNSRNPAIRSAALAAIRALVHNLDNALLVDILANKAQLICGQAKFDLTSTVADMVVEVYSRKPKVVEKEVLPLLWHMLAINNKSTATEALFKALYSQMGSKLMETSMNAQRNEDNKAPVHGIMARKICDEQVQVEGRRSSAQETSMNAQSNEHNKAPVHGIMAKKTCDEQVQVESSGLTAQGTSTNEHTPITARMQDSPADESEKCGLPSTLHSETERPALPRSQATKIPGTYAFIAKMKAQMESKDYKDRIKAIEQLAESCCLNPTLATSGIFSVYDGIRGRLVESNRNVNLHMLKALEVIIPQLKEGLPKVASGLIPAIVDNHLNSRNPAIRSAALAAIRALVHNLDNALLVEILANKAQLICGQAKFDLTSTVADMVVEVYSRKPKVVEKEAVPLLWHMLAINNKSTATEALFKALYSQMGSKLMACGVSQPASIINDLDHLLLKF